MPFIPQLVRVHLPARIANSVLDAIFADRHGHTPTRAPRLGLGTFALWQSIPAATRCLDEPVEMTGSSTYPLRLPRSIKCAVEKAARQEGISMNQFEAMAVAVNLAVRNSAICFVERMGRADLKAFGRSLSSKDGENATHRRRALSPVASWLADHLVCAFLGHQLLPHEGSILVEGASSNPGAVHLYGAAMLAEPELRHPLRFAPKRLDRRHAPWQGCRVDRRCPEGGAGASDAVAKARSKT